MGSERLWRYRIRFDRSRWPKSIDGYWQTMDERPVVGVNLPSPDAGGWWEVEEYEKVDAWTTCHPTDTGGE